jgi:hypothetical protein
MDGYIDLTDQGLDKLDRTEGRMNGWTDTHVTYINRFMRVARECVCVCVRVKEQAAPTPATYRPHGSTYCSKFGRQRAPNSNTGKFTIFNIKEES